MRQLQLFVLLSVLLSLFNIVLLWFNMICFMFSMHLNLFLLYFCLVFFVVCSWVGSMCLASWGTVYQCLMLRVCCMVGWTMWCFFFFCFSVCCFGRYCLWVLVCTLICRYIHFFVESLCIKAPDWALYHLWFSNIYELSFFVFVCVCACVCVWGGGGG